MKVKNLELYHVHRNGVLDHLWQVGNEIIVDDKYTTNYYSRIKTIDQYLSDRYGEYNIDSIISVMEKMNEKDFMEDILGVEYHTLLNQLYFLRRELALEEARTIYNPESPSRFHCLFLTDSNDLPFWEAVVGDGDYNTYLLELTGKVFISSDTLLPKSNLAYDLQIKQAEEYWTPTPKQLLKRREFLFQGKGKIIE